MEQGLQKVHTGPEQGGDGLRQAGVGDVETMAGMEEGGGGGDALHRVSKTCCLRHQEDGEAGRWKIIRFWETLRKITAPSVFTWGLLQV